MAGLQSTIVSYKKVGCTNRSSTTSNVENHFYTTCRCTRKTPGIYYNVLVEFLLKFTDIISLYEWKGCYAHTCGKFVETHARLNVGAASRVVQK